MKKTILYLAILGLQTNLPGQNNFKVGMFGIAPSDFWQTTTCALPWNHGVPYTQRTAIIPSSGVSTPIYTSILGVLSDDGCNAIQSYCPDTWLGKDVIKGIMDNTAANNMKIQLSLRSFYMPDQFNNNTGTNKYDNCNLPLPGSCYGPYSILSNGLPSSRPNFDDFISTVFNQTPYKDIILGYQVTEEASYGHYYPYACTGTSGGTSTLVTLNNFDGDHKLVEVPPSNVGNALTYYKNALSTHGIGNHKLAIMEANHGKSIHATTQDGQGVNNPQDYIQLFNTPDNRNVFFEGSYYRHPGVNWKTAIYSDIATNSGWHYLGNFKAIDYAKQFSEVQDVITLEYYNYTNPSDIYHSDSNILNANWLWFQAYTSIIHGAKGVWFWGLNYAWNNSEAPGGVAPTNWSNPNINRYDRSYFPANYKNFAGHLTKELGFLTKKNILSSDDNSVIYTKTDQADVNCIVPTIPPIGPSYITQGLQAAYGNNWASITGLSEKNSENYGLRYTIRTNGSEVFMIISNPLNISLHNVQLNFSNTANLIIQNSTGVEVLFDNNASAVNNSNYKLNRNSTIDLTNLTVGSKHTINYAGNKQLFLSFGPMDVKVLKFVTGAIPDCNNGWDMVYTNNGSGHIGGHFVEGNHLFYPGDFDGDGAEELLCVDYNASSNGDWMTIVKYNATSGGWDWKWSNNGNSSLGIYPYRHMLIVGDFNGDGKDDLLGNDPTGWTTLFTYDPVTNVWNWAWSDYGNTSHQMWIYKNKMYPGDFNGDGKDELIAFDTDPGGWSAEFAWNGSDFAWTGWTDFNNASHPIRAFRDYLKPGDYNGDGKTDLLGMGATSAVLFIKVSGDWASMWTNGTSGTFGGWGYPPNATDAILTGNTDSDSKDEVMFIQRGTSASWSTSLDYYQTKFGLGWNWNWSANPNTCTYIDNWPLPSGGAGIDTKYLFIKAKASDPKYLLAMRGTYCNKYLVSMYKTNTANNYKTADGDALTINDLSEAGNSNSFAMYPNPAEKVVTLIFNEDTLYNTITITDIRGVVVKEIKDQHSKELKLNIEELSKGIYFIKVENSIGVQTKKLIVH